MSNAINAADDIVSDATLEKWRETGLLDGLTPEKEEMIVRTLQNKMEGVISGNITYQEFEEEIVCLRNAGMFSKKET